MEELEKLFGSAAKVKIMKLFLLNPDSAFSAEDIRRRSQVTAKSARREMALLGSIGFIKKQTISQSKASKQGKVNMKKVPGWTLNLAFPYIKPLQFLLVHTSSLSNEDIKKRFARAGNIKLIVISGVFIQDWDSRLDLLVVGDNLKNQAVNTAVKTLESEVGRELKYSVFSTDDFHYRSVMCDKLIRDILDYPHQKVVNKLEVE